MNARGQYGSHSLSADRGQYMPASGQYMPASGQYMPARGQYGPPRTDAGKMIISLALHVAGILLIGLGLAFLLIRWSGA